MSFYDGAEDATLFVIHNLQCQCFNDYRVEVETFALQADVEFCFFIFEHLVPDSFIHIPDELFVIGSFKCQCFF